VNWRSQRNWPIADEMAVQGLLRSDIAKSLEISLMTYHRWCFVWRVCLHVNGANLGTCRSKREQIESDQKSAD
jgi:hypothetical protein